MWEHPGKKAILATLLAVGLGACGDLTAGGAGEADVFVRGDDAPESASYAQPTSHAQGGEWDGEAEDGPVHGEVRVTIQVLAVPQAGGPVDLTGGFREVVVDADGSAAIQVALADLTPTDYTGILVRFTRVEAEIQSSTGVDLPFVGTVVVDFGDDEVLDVERNVPFLLREGGRVSIEVNLRTGSWLRAAGPALPVVTAAQFRNSLRVEVDTNGG